MTHHNNPYKVLIAAGGTGGHIFPAIAIADAIKHQLPSCDITFAGTRSHLEWTVVPQAGYTIKPIWISGFQRKFSFANLLFPIKLLVSLLQSTIIISKTKPNVVICCGGYVSGPIGRIAALLRRPLMLQEQNSYPGVTNRLLGKKSHTIFTAFSEAAKYFPIKKVKLLGNPIRSDIFNGNRNAAASTYNFNPARKTLLIMGGSGGAASLNQAMLRHIDYLHNELHLQIIWQCGKRYLGEMSTKLDQTKYPDLHLVSFIDSMPDVYALADLVVCRSGAGTISELLALGKPSILVPSPNVAGNHQYHNAESVVKNGGAMMIEDHHLEEQLAKNVASVISNTKNLVNMGQRALSMGHPDAANQIAIEILEMTNPDFNTKN